jgi:integrase
VRASLQTSAGAHGEAERLRRLAAERGTLDLEPTTRTITFSEFVEQTFKPLYMPAKCRPSTRERYNDLLRQGVLDEFRDLRLDEDWAVPMMTFASKLSKRGVQTRPHLTLVRTILRAAVEFKALARLPQMPSLPKPGRKLPAAPSDEDVTKLLGGARGWLHVAVALAIYGGLRMGEVRALEVRDIDFARSRIHVRRAFSADEVLSPKSTHERAVPLASPLRAILEPLVRGKRGDTRIVQNGAGRTPRRQHVLTVLKRLESKLGLALGPSMGFAITSARRCSGAALTSKLFESSRVTRA